ncbi:MAG: hypothetical protein ACP5N1_01755 [Candidatus Woesearchaeota archaeon]
MQKGFLRLNDDELYWLEDRVNTIDVQNGCPWQCISCGVDAPKHSGSMAWSDYIALSDSILDVESKKGINLISYECLCSFSKSDPMYYHSFDGKIEKTIYDILKDIMLKHHANTYITTAGWKSGNNYMQRAAEKIVEMYGNGFIPDMYYSVKTVSKQILKEYDLYLKNSPDKSVDDLSFIKNSRYVSNLINNIKTFNNLKIGNVNYIFNYFDNDDIAQLNSDYVSYSSIFSKKFMQQVYKYINEKERLIPGLALNSFSGLGRALTIGDICVDWDLNANNSIIDSNTNVEDYVYNVHINSKGTLEIYIGSTHSLSKVLVPKSYFNNLAHLSSGAREIKMYKMLENLQGKNLLI